MWFLQESVPGLKFRLDYMVHVHHKLVFVYSAVFLTAIAIRIDEKCVGS